MLNDRKEKHFKRVTITIDPENYVVIDSFETTRFQLLIRAQCERFWICITTAMQLIFLEEAVLQARVTE
jgi:hypothetical protein